MSPICAVAFMPPFPNEAVRRVSTSASWTCSATSNNALVQNLVDRQIVTIPRIEQVMGLIDRRAFLPPNTPPSHAYADSPHPLPCAATISAPHMHALALELLNDHLSPGCAALDVGTGSGYFAACMAALVGPTGTVIALEHAPQLSQFATANLDNFSATLPPDRVCTVVVRTADGRLGDAQNAPFSAIHVGAAAPDVPPALISQLALGGAMVVPVGHPQGSQRLVLLTKAADGTVSDKTVCHVRYVPLCDLNHQLAQ